MISVAIANRQKLLRVYSRGIRRVVRAVLKGEAVDHADISIALVDNSTIHRLNRKFVGHNWPTDVITFPLGDAGDSGLSAELIISAEMARGMAQHLGHSAFAELSLYLIHGLLHLCGFDDHGTQQRHAMHERERYYLRALGLRLNERPNHAGAKKRRQNKGRKTKRTRNA